MTVSIDIEEYKELLAIKIGKEYEEQIKKLQEELEDVRTNEQYWYSRFCDERKEKEELKESLRNMEAAMGCEDGPKGDEAA